MGQMQKQKKRRALSQVQSVHFVEILSVQKMQSSARTVLNRGAMKAHNKAFKSLRSDAQKAARRLTGRYIARE